MRGAEKKEDLTVFTVLGSAGGVAKSILSILNLSASNDKDPIYRFLMHSKIYLIDSMQKDSEYYQKLYPYIFDKFIILQFNLKVTTIFFQQLKTSKTKMVIDVLWADTIEMIECCNKLGIYYVNTALENTMIDEKEEDYTGFPLIECICIFEKHKNKFTNMKGVIGSGMNPGVVQWMALELLKLYPEKPRWCYFKLIKTDSLHSFEEGLIYGKSD